MFTCAVGICRERQVQPRFEWDGQKRGEKRQSLPDGLEVRKRVRLVLQVEVVIAEREGLVGAGKAVALTVGDVCGWLS